MNKSKEKKRQNELEEAEDNKSDELTSAVLLFLLSKKTDMAIATSVAALASLIEKHTTATRNEGLSIALSYLSLPKPKKEITSTPRTLAASNKLAATIVSTTVGKILQGDKRSDAVISSVEQHKGKINQIVSTELFSEHNQTISGRQNKNKSDATIVYSATLDKRACSKCASLDGREYKKGENIPEIPQHPNCRCFWIVKDK